LRLTVGMEASFAVFVVTIAGVVRKWFLDSGYWRDPAPQVSQ
jgi:hypothetical protein